jgi:predicted ATPase/DNA-binding XRE family transcriptional regulator
MTETGFGDLLRRYRLAAGLTQEELAERAGVSTRGISDLERGARGLPRKDTLQLLLQALDLSPADRTALVAAARPSPSSSRRDSTGGRPLLPKPLTSLIGREAELTNVTNLLGDPAVRLLTLTGPGGTGKTRLALEVASEVAEAFPDGVVFVPLASLIDPTLVASTMAQCLGLREGAGQSPVERLTTHLGDKRMLLVLDNFEHLQSAAPLVTDLLAVCPWVTVLVTSRVRLRLRGEREVLVPPLALPKPTDLPEREELALVPAVRLFVERAQDVKADFTLTKENAPAIAEICHRLDGLPLALELAAARIKILSPAALLARLDRRLLLLTGGAQDLPDRQKTLRDTIAWSYDLLPADEQALFRRLSVFVGGFTLEAAEAIADAAGELGAGVIDGIASLVDKSLLRQVDQTIGDLRFGMLETVREFGFQQLEESDDEDRVRAAHAAYFLNMAEEAAPWLERDQQVVWLACLEAEHANVRAAITWLRTRDDSTFVLRFGAALWLFWFGRHAEEGLRWLVDALASGGGADPLLRAAALHGAGNLARDRDDPKQGEAFHREELALRRAIRDEAGIGKTLLPLGVEAREQEDFARAEELLAESASRLSVSGDTWALSIAIKGLGDVALVRGDLEQARAHYTEGLNIARERGDRYNMAEALTGLGRVAMISGEFDAAVPFYNESIALAREAGDAQGVATSLGHLALARIETGEVDSAEALLGEALTVADGVESVALRSWLRLAVGRISRLRGDQRRAAHSYIEALRLAAEIRSYHRSHLSECLDEVAAFIATTGDVMRAARCWGAAEGLRKAIGLWWRRSSEIERTMRAAREAIGATTFARGWEDGQSVAVEVVVSEALAHVQELVRESDQAGALSMSPS